MNWQPTSSNRTRNIILVGMPGTGKTIFGKIYAIRTGRRFLDFDNYIERHSAITIGETIKTAGECAFRERLETSLRRLERKHSTVICINGGAICNSRYFRFLRTVGLVVQLKAPIDILAKRLQPTLAERPLFNNVDSLKKTEELLQDLQAKREVFYECADVEIDSEFNSIDCMVLQMYHYERQAHNIMQKRIIPKVLLEDKRNFYTNQQTNTNDPQNPTVESFTPAEKWDDIIWRSTPVGVEQHQSKKTAEKPKHPRPNTKEREQQ